MMLDIPADKGAGRQTFVYNVENAKAADLAAVLNELFGGGEGGGGGPGRRPGQPGGVGLFGAGGAAGRGPEAPAPAAEERPVVAAGSAAARAGRTHEGGLLLSR